MTNETFKIKESMYAGKGKRFANYIIDRILVTSLFSAVGILLGVMAESSGDYEMLMWLEHINPVVDYLVTGVLFSLYYIVFECWTQKTIGKMLTKTIVVDENGNKPSVGSIIGRSLCRMIPFNHFSFLGSKGRGWHDSLSKTYVVDVKTQEEQKQLFESLNKLGEIGEEDFD
ncbi:MAG: RDD family protein [Flavobacteriaceae bacterium]|nr:RDD family protein [Flavobacteriaceae bacterium]